MKNLQRPPRRGTEVEGPATGAITIGAAGTAATKSPKVSSSSNSTDTREESYTGLETVVLRDWANKMSRIRSVPGVQGIAKA